MKEPSELVACTVAAIRKICCFVVVVVVVVFSFRTYRVLQSSNCKNDMAEIMTEYTTVRYCYSEVTID